MKVQVEVFTGSKDSLNDIISENETVVLYFGSTSCGVCHAVFPKLMDALTAIPVNVLKINIDEQSVIAGQFLVFAVPTVIVVRQGKEILRDSRFIDLQKIKRILSV